MNFQDKDICVDVTIIGSGIAGGILAAILAKHGIDVLLIDKIKHPKFAIGESTIPETALLLKILALRFNIPEFEYISTFQNIKTILPSSGIKRNFGFIYHDYQQSINQSSHQLGSANDEHAIIHFYRQDVDSYVAKVAQQYGCRLLEEIEISNLAINEDNVVISTNKALTIECSYVIDAGGFQSFLANKFKLRTTNNIKTQTNSIFTHMLSVKYFDDCMHKIAEPQQLSPWHQGTLHHVFPQGWMWVIPFNNFPGYQNNICSVGLQLNKHRYQQSDALPAERFQKILDQYPLIGKQFVDATPVRPWIDVERLQYSATETVGYRFCLLSHAAGFIDPLYSRGLYNTLSIINAIAPLLINAKRTNQFGGNQFFEIDTLQKTLLAANDNLVSHAYIAFNDFRLWNMWFRVWGLVASVSGATTFQLHKQFNKTGNEQLFQAFNQLIKKNGFAIDDETAAIFNESCRTMERYDQKEIDITTAEKIIIKLFNDALYLPPNFPYSDPHQHYPILNNTTQLAIQQWLGG